MSRILLKLQKRVKLFCSFPSMKTRVPLFDEISLYNISLYKFWNADEAAEKLYLRLEVQSFFNTQSLT